ncbi:MAG: cyclase family protein [Pseudomonadota bacterium]
MRIIDLSLPIAPGHVRWRVEQTVSGNIDAGDLFQTTTLKLPCHGFTHVDAQRHFFAGQPTIEATPLDAVVGFARVINLTDVAANEPIDVDRVRDRVGSVAPNEKLILATTWCAKASYETEAFWRTAPYLTRDAAVWLRDAGVGLVAYDFPQDYVIRLLLDGEIRPIAEHVTHDVLLRAGVQMVEYLTNTDQLSADRVFLSAAPLKVPDADGSPARVYAIEGLDH